MFTALKNLGDKSANDSVADWFIFYKGHGIASCQIHAEDRK
jgi:hypothetical protein